MAGIYIHIPFCKQACSYCDFHFSTNLKYMDDMVEALVKEIEFRKDFFALTGQSKIKSIYFGGGTPSILPIQHIEKIFSSLETHFEFENQIEITLEANPDDLNKTKLRELKATPINRFSIGIQSFHERDLKIMNRAHTAQQAEEAIKRAQDLGFENLTVDFIYGTPGLSNQELTFNLAKAIELEVPHISCYALTIEEKTLLQSLIKKKRITPISDDQQANQFNLIMDVLKEKDFEHYEISNWSKPGKRAIHNSNYWKGEPYLGIGPSAHSFNGKNIRSSNVRNNSLYLKQIFEKNYKPSEEELSKNQVYNEYILVRLRTIEGVNSLEIEHLFGFDYRMHFEKKLKNNLDLGLINLKNYNYTLTQQGKLFADKIASDAFLV